MDKRWRIRNEGEFGQDIDGPETAQWVDVIPADDVDRLANDLASEWRERAEKAEAEVTVWKTRLVEETARLRDLNRGEPLTADGYPDALPVNP